MILGGNPIIDAFQIIRGGKIEGMGDDSDKMGLMGLLSTAVGFGMVIGGLVQMVVAAQVAFRKAGGGFVGFIAGLLAFFFAPIYLFLYYPLKFGGITDKLASKLPDVVSKVGGALSAFGSYQF